MNHRAPAAPTVSVVTPAYNAGRFLAGAIDSVRQQTHDDLEMIIVDDGSTDDTAAVAERYLVQDPRIRLFRQANRGISAARNAALAHARGRYVALLDSDDLWLPVFLAEQLRILEHRPDIGILSANAFNLGGAWDGTLLLPIDPAPALHDVSLIQLVQAESSMSILSVCRRSLIDALGGFDEALGRSEDYDLWLRAAAMGARLVVNPQPLGFYRRRPGSLSSDELGMLHAMQRPLAKLRVASTGRREVIEAVERQLANLAHRELTARARHALLSNDMPLLAAQFEALAATTGDWRYRVGRWMARRAPLAVRCAYRLKQIRGRRGQQRSAPLPGPTMPTHPVSRAHV